MVWSKPQNFGTFFFKIFVLTQLTNKKSVWSVTYVAQWWSLKKMILVNNFFKKLEETET